MINHKYMTCYNDEGAYDLNYSLRASKSVSFRIVWKQLLSFGINIYLKKRKEKKKKKLSN